MTYKDLTYESRMRIRSAVMQILLRMGIDVDITLYAKTIYDGRELVYFESEEFQTTPVIYRKVNVYGEGFLNDEANGLCRLHLSLSYRFKYFGGGENGVDIVHLTFIIRNFDDGRQTAIIENCDFVINNNDIYNNDF